MSADIGKTSAGTVSGLMNMGGQMGGALTATLTPAIAMHFGWMASFLVAAALCVLGALAWIPVGSPKRGVVSSISAIQRTSSLTKKLKASLKHHATAVIITSQKRTFG